MITFYRTEECPHCAAIQEVLEGLALAHTVVVVEELEDPELPHDSQLPALEDDGQMIRGREAVLKHLEGLSEFKAEWEKFQTDACYCDDEGDVI